MPVFLGTLTLDQQTSDVNILAAGEALLAQHNHAISLDANNDDVHGHLTVSENGTIAEDSCGHSCAHHDHGKNGTAKQAQSGSAPVTKPTVPEVVVPSKVVGKRIATNTAIVLENAAHGYVKPNILDAKLGVRLYADDASAEKKARFDKVSAETTHKDLGFRIAGMRVWHGEGAKGEDIDSEGYKIYDKNYGRVFVNKDNIVDAFRNFLFSEGADVDEELGRLVAQAFAADVKKIQQVLEGQESKMFSASLLFVFEGDGKALRAAMEEASNPKPKPATNGNGDSNGATPEHGEDDEEDLDEGPKIYSVKLIDFAHAEWVPGNGPDENCLKGVRSIADIMRKIGGI